MASQGDCSQTINMDWGHAALELHPVPTDVTSPEFYSFGMTHVPAEIPMHDISGKLCTPLHQ